jgi:hypothetical protein
MGRREALKSAESMIVFFGALHDLEAMWKIHTQIFQ